MCTNRNYTVLISDYAQKHYIKSYKKKYKSVWWTTFDTIHLMLSRIEIFSRTTKVNKIHISETCYIAKCEFTIAWSNISTHASWNRIIVFVDEESLKVHILLIYAKTDCWSNNETAWWQEQIKCNHQEIWNMVGLK